MLDVYKRQALYWAARCVVMLDPALDVAALAKQGVRFDTPRDVYKRQGCGTAGLMVFAFGHKKSPYHKKKADL